MIFIIKEGIRTLLKTSDYYNAKQFYFRKRLFKRALSNRPIKLLVHFATAKYPKIIFQS